MSAPRHVRVAGRVVSEDVVASPMSGLAAALVRWTFLAVVQVGGGGRGGGPRFRGTPVLSGCFGAELRLTTADREIVVPLEGLQLAYEGAADLGDPVLSPLPEPFRCALSQVSWTGALHYRERLVRCGEWFVVDAMVAAAGEATDPYRSDRGRWHACPWLRPTVLREIASGDADAEAGAVR